MEEHIGILKLLRSDDESTPALLFSDRGDSKMSLGKKKGNMTYITPVVVNNSKPNIGELCLDTIENKLKIYDESFIATGHRCLNILIAPDKFTTNQLEAIVHGNICEDEIVRVRPRIGGLFILNPYSPVFHWKETEKLLIKILGSYELFCYEKGTIPSSQEWFIENKSQIITDD